MIAQTVHESASCRVVTAQDRYLFDLQGYLVVPDAIPAGLHARLERAFDAHAHEAPAGVRTHRWMDVLAWGPALRTLIDLPSVLPLVEAFIGGEVRLDHDYGDIIAGGDGPIGSSLHGGNTPYDTCCSYQYRSGSIRSGLLAVAFNLRAIGDEGGFGCIPGSHKANEPLPPEWRPLETPAACVRAVRAPAGSAILFTEGLTHGTLPWRYPYARRTLFFKYSPACMSWLARYYDARTYPEISERARQLLEAPNARYGGRHP
jgi:hypothetical protein